MIISLIVAASTNNAIGKGNQLPWHLPNDMKFFKNTTWGLPVVMGRKTFESLNSKPLPGRINVVITRQSKLKADGFVISKSFDDAMFIIKETDCNEIFIIGGGEIFKEMMPKANRIYMTRVHTNLDGDVFFPDIDKSKWNLVKSRDCFTDDKHDYDYTFETWEKK